MAQLLGQMAVGSIVKLNENGSPTNYIVVNQGIPGNSPLYDASCNGTWLLRQDIPFTSNFNGSGNNYANSSAKNNMNAFPNAYDPDIQTKVVNAIIPYCVGGGSSTVNSGSNGVSVKCFLLSYTELGFSGSPYAATEGAILEYFNTDGNNRRIATYNGITTGYWTRSPYTDASFPADVWTVTTAGGSITNTCTYNYGRRPAVIFPQSMLVMDDGSLSASILPPTLTVPSQAMQGQSIPINWTASANADSYQLQRNTGSGWSTIYTGPNLTFTDTAGSWSTVQYQVAAGLGGEYGEYATSAIIPVVSASALVISGTNEDLGTITADIPYTVTSDTGNQITHTLTVNGVQFATATEASGVAHSIPVMELPTGTGTIVITASVQATSGPVTATRTWTYTKAPISFPDAAGVGVLQKNGQNFLPATLAELVRTNPFWGGSLSTALEMLTGVQALGNGLGNQYLWEKTKDVPSYTSEHISVSTQIAQQDLNAGVTWTCGNDFTVNEDGSYFILESPETIQLNASNYQEVLRQTEGKYVMNTSYGTSSAMYKFTSQSTFSWSSNNLLMGQNFTEFSKPKIETQSFGYVNSASPTAYPPSPSDGYTYTPLGQLGAFAKIEVGSYTGTGSYGLNSKNTYTFSRPPKFVIILGDDDYISNAIGFYVWGMKYMGGANGTDGGENYAYPEGNQLSWFSAANSASQLNQSGVKYYVVSFY